MLLNSLFAIAFFTIVLLLTAPGPSFQLRLFGTGLSLLVLGWSSIKSLWRGLPLPFLDWIVQPRASRRYLPLASIFLAAALLFYALSPRQGIRFTFTDTRTGQSTIRILDLPVLDINPTLFLPALLNIDQGIMRFSCAFRVFEEAFYALPHTSNGRAVWKLDGTEIVRFEADESSRHRLVPVSLQPGLHEIECETTSLNPIPRLSIAFSQFHQPPFTPLQGPFIQGLPPISPVIYPLSRILSSLFLLLAFFFWIPTLNHLCLAIAAWTQRHATLFMSLGWVAGIVWFVVIRLNFYKNICYYEADEAAFGLMAQRLQTGQSPPLFHYGQPYQGTVEAFPLALSLFWGKSPAVGLHALPEIWGLLFIALTCVTFWQFGSPALALCAFLCLGLGGLHYHWIFSKTWFGYSFSLVCGAGLWFLVLSGWRAGRLSPGKALLWGSLAGLSFYELPIVLPFILSSGLLLLHLAGRRIMRLWIDFPSPHSMKHKALMGVIQSGAALAFLSLLLFTAPYWISPFLGEGLSALEFVAKGRALPAARVAGENPLLDRFLGECLPVFFGSRAPYDHQHDLPAALFPWFPPLFFLIGLVLFPWISSRVQTGEKMLSEPVVRNAIFAFMLLTILFVSYSPFGVWPWYAIPLYWSLPVLLFVFIRFLWRISPSLAAASLIIYGVSLTTPLADYSPLYHQPASLSYQGLWIPTRFEEIKSALRERSIRYLLCDQGFDYLTGTPGRDWVGECLAFDANQDILAFGRLSRRLEDSAQEIVNAARVGYLFHKDFYYNNTTGDPMLYSALTMENLEALFGPRWLNYDRLEMDPYILFLPPRGEPRNPKNTWRLEASNPNYQLAAADNNISVRAYNRETYWSSDAIPASGAYFRVTFPAPRSVSKLILFHGTKSSDRTRENLVMLKTPQGANIVAGSLRYEPEIRSSVLVLNDAIEASGVEIHVSPTPDNSWWTIFEIWIL